MDIRGLRYFISVANHLNFTKAAKECFISQTAMSQHVASMEKELGFALFDRDNRNVRLTPAGKDFYDQIRILLSNYDNAVAHSQNLSSGGTGAITIAVGSCCEGMTFLPRFNSFREQYPEIKLNVCVYPPHEIPEKLRCGAVDIAITWPHDLLDEDMFAVQNIADFKSYAVCAQDHPLAANSSVKPEDLVTEQFIMMDLREMPSTYRTMCTEWKQLGLNPPTPKMFDNINSLDEIVLAVSMDNGVALVPEFLVKNSIGNLHFMKLETKMPLLFSNCVVYLNNNPNPVVQMAIDVLRDNRIPLNY